jgi:hypothetical protein
MMILNHITKFLHIILGLESLALILVLPMNGYTITLIMMSLLLFILTHTYIIENIN